MRLTSLVAVSMSLTSAPHTEAREQTTASAPRKLVVGTRHAPPFAIERDDGSWTGVSIDLWRDIANRLHLDYELRESKLSEMLPGLGDGRFDAVVAALTVTAEREKGVDFTHPFHTSGLGIAVSGKTRGGWAAVLSRLGSPAFLRVLLVLLVLLFVAGGLVWVFERRRNPEQFGPRPGKGLAAAFWWSAVTMTTVGYGDKAPKTVGGRVVALIWMFAGLIAISSFTAAITASLTVSQLRSPVRGPEDLPRVRVATVPGSTSEAYLRSHHIGAKPFETPLDGLRAVAAGEVDAFVYDAPILKYLVARELDGAVGVLPRTFERQDYGIALPSGSVLRERVNQVLLETIAQPSWQDVLYRHMGG